MTKFLLDQKAIKVKFYQQERIKKITLRAMNWPFSKWFKLFLYLLTFFSLTACTSSKDQAMIAWLQENKSDFELLTQLMQKQEFTDRYLSVVANSDYETPEVSSSDLTEVRRLLHKLKLHSVRRFNSSESVYFTKVLDSSSFISPSIARSEKGYIYTPGEVAQDNLRENLDNIPFQNEHSYTRFVEEDWYLYISFFND